MHAKTDRDNIKDKDITQQEKIKNKYENILDK